MDSLGLSELQRVEAEAIHQRYREEYDKTLAARTAIHQWGWGDQGRHDDVSHGYIPYDLPRDELPFSYMRGLDFQRHQVAQFELIAQLDRGYYAELRGLFPHRSEAIAALERQWRRSKWQPTLSTAMGAQVDIMALVETTLGSEALHEQAIAAALIEWENAIELAIDAMIEARIEGMIDPYKYRRLALEARATTGDYSAVALHHSRELIVARGGLEANERAVNRIAVAIPHDHSDRLRQVWLEAKYPTFWSKSLEAAAIKSALAREDLSDDQRVQMEAINSELDAVRAHMTATLERLQKPALSDDEIIRYWQAMYTWRFSGQEGPPPTRPAAVAFDTAGREFLEKLKALAARAEDVINAGGEGQSQ